MLPQQKTAPKADLADLTILLYGPSKFGKSTFCSYAEGALFIATEPGLNHLECYQQEVTTWAEFLQTCASLREEEHMFRTNIIDTVDNLYRMCTEHVCKKEKIEHPGDLEYGKGYALVNNEFHRALTKLAMLRDAKGRKMGLWLISHAQHKEIKTPVGAITRTVPTLSDKANRIVLSLVDMILYGEIIEKDGKQQRVLRTKPTKTYDAGDRTGRLPETLALDFPGFVKAFEESKAQKAA